VCKGARAFFSVERSFPREAKSLLGCNTRKDGGCSAGEME
jgi:hypothetical protein